MLVDFKYVTRHMNMYFHNYPIFPDLFEFLFSQTQFHVIQGINEISLYFFFHILN